MRALRDAPVDITLVDANNFHTFQPLLYQVATAGLDTDDVAHPVRRAVRGRRRGSVDVVMARVTGIDVDAHRVELFDGTELGYDSLVVAAGAVSTDFGVPGIDEHGYPLKTLDSGRPASPRARQFRAASRRPDRAVAGGARRRRVRRGSDRCRDGGRSRGAVRARARRGLPGAAGTDARRSCSSRRPTGC